MRIVHRKDKHLIEEGDLLLDENGEYWLYLYGHFSSFEPDPEKRKQLIKEGISKHFYNLLNIMLKLKLWN